MVRFTKQISNNYTSPSSIGDTLGNLNLALIPFGTLQTRINSNYIHQICGGLKKKIHPKTQNLQNLIIKKNQLNKHVELYE